MLLATDRISIDFQFFMQFGSENIEKLWMNKFQQYFEAVDESMK